MGCYSYISGDVLEPHAFWNTGGYGLKTDSVESPFIRLSLACKKGLAHTRRNMILIAPSADDISQLGEYEFFM